MSAIVISPMHSWQLQQVLAIEHDLFRIDPWSIEQFYSELAGVPDSRYYVVASVDDVVVGYAGISFFAPDSDINTIAVAADRHRQGIGRALLEHLMAAALQRGCTRMMLEARTENAPAISMYRNYGFDIIANRPNYYAPGVDAVIMECADLAGAVA